MGAAVLVVVFQVWPTPDANGSTALDVFRGMLPGLFWLIVCRAAPSLPLCHSALTICCAVSQHVVLGICRTASDRAREYVRRTHAHIGQSLVADNKRNRNYDTGACMTS
jgi:hypothetical protein